MMRVGLTGGLASGKSVVGTILASLGCHVVRADELGHRVLAPDGEAYPAAVKEFGPGILREDGTIDRKALARIVFADPQRLDRLNNIVHPVVFLLEERFLSDAATKDPTGIGVVEAAILIETGSYRKYDRLVLAVCSEEQQIERAMRRDRCTRSEAEARLRRQMPLSEKLAYAHHLIDTSGTLDSTAEQTRRLFDGWRSLSQPA